MYVLLVYADVLNAASEGIQTINNVPRNAGIP